MGPQAPSVCGVADTATSLLNPSFSLKTHSPVCAMFWSGAKLLPCRLSICPSVCSYRVNCFSIVAGLLLISDTSAHPYLAEQAQRPRTVKQPAGGSQGQRRPHRASLSRRWPSRGLLITEKLVGRPLHSSSSCRQMGTLLGGSGKGRPRGPSEEVRELGLLGENSAPCLQGKRARVRLAPGHPLPTLAGRVH